MPKLTDTQDRLIEAALLVLFFVLIRINHPMPASDDLRALWMAGRFFEDGAAGVYAMSGEYFRMVPPDFWVTTYLAEGTDAAAYPFIYPPIWAWIMQHVVAITDFDTLSRIASSVNALLMVGCFYLASRMARATMSRSAFMAIAVFIAFAFGSLLIQLPLNENQPQILVSFLVLLAVERERAGRPVVAGAVMALAAAIKLYPVIFAVLWLVAGRKKPVISFAVIGAALGFASLFVGGWPMHAAFLAEIRAISASALVTVANVSLDSLIAALFVDTAQTEFINTNATGGTSSWLIYEKPPVWRAVNVVLQAITLALLICFAAKTRLQNVLVWPVIFVALAWVLPLSWLYHYLPAFAFLPAMIAHFGWRRGIYAMMPPAFATSSAFFLMILALPAGKIIIYPVVSLAMVWIGLVFLWIQFRSDPEPPL